MEDQIIKALTLLVVTMSAIFAKRASMQAAEANDAVNHRHADGSPRLYDLAIRNDQRLDELLEWKRGYDGGPLDTGQKVTDFMAEFEKLRASCQCEICPFKQESKEQE
jgi:hypothetical protein